MADVEIDVTFPDPIITDVVIDRMGPGAVGVPTGGTTGQHLAKASNTDYDFDWVAADQDPDWTNVQNKPAYATQASDATHDGYLKQADWSTFNAKVPTTTTVNGHALSSNVTVTDSDLGATTVGDAFFKLTNPSAITFARINANNTVDALSASAFRTAIGAGTGGGDALTSNPLSQFASTTSAQLRSVLSDENGTGVAIFDGATSPTFVTPALGTPSALVGTNITGTAAGLSIGGSAASLSATLAVASGGTNITSYAIGDLLYASGATTLAKLADVATGNALISGGVTTAPSWGKITTSHTTGIAASGSNSDITALSGLTGAIATPTSITYSTFLKSTTALATPSALSATQFTGFASTVSGASLMGYGTTNDVSLMNRAGTVVLGVGPNTTAVTIPGAITSNGTFSLAKTSAASTRESLFRGTVSDAGNDAFFMFNGSSGDALFIPSFGGYHDSSSSRSSLNFHAFVSAANDASNSAANGLASFRFSRTDSASDPTNGTLSDVVNRKLLSICTFDGTNETFKLGIYPSGGLWIGSATTIGTDPGIGCFNATGTTDSTTATTGTIKTAGGMGVVKSVTIGVSLSIGGAAFPSANNTAVEVYANNTSKPTLAANTTAFYQKGGEQYVQDASGNETLISPHMNGTDKWIFYSENERTGRRIKVDMEKLVHLVEKFSGEQVMEETWAT